MIQWWEGGWGEVPDKLVVQGGCDSPDPAERAGWEGASLPYCALCSTWEEMAGNGEGKDRKGALQSCSGLLTFRLLRLWQRQWRESGLSGGMTGLFTSWVGQITTLSGFYWLVSKCLFAVECCKKSLKRPLFLQAFLIVS